MTLEQIKDKVLGNVKLSKAEEIVLETELVTLSDVVYSHDMNCLLEDIRSYSTLEQKGWTMERLEKVLFPLSECIDNGVDCPECDGYRDDIRELERSVKLLEDDKDNAESETVDAQRERDQAEGREEDLQDQVDELQMQVADLEKELEMTKSELERVQNGHSFVTLGYN